jgi:hypothetical protein
MPGQGVVVEGVKGGKKSPQQAVIHKKGAENKWFQFPALFGLKFAKNAIFCSKVPKGYAPKMLFEKYIN